MNDRLEIASRLMCSLIREGRHCRDNFGALVTKELARDAMKCADALIDADRETRPEEGGTQVESVPGECIQSTPPLPWSEVPEGFDWVAMDEDGEWGKFRPEPTRGFCMWLSRGGYSELPATGSHLHWTETKRRRPGTEDSQ